MKSMYLSVVSLIVAVLTLFYVVCYGVKADNAAMLVSLLGVMTTLLVAWNIVQYIFAKKEISRIAIPIANKATESIAMDIAHVFNGKLLMQEAVGPIEPGTDMQRIDTIFKAIEEYSKCSKAMIAQSSLDASLQILQTAFEEMKEKNDIRVLQEKKEHYQSILQDVRSPYQQACNALLYMAKEKPKDYDTQILSPSEKKVLHYNKHSV